MMRIVSVSCIIILRHGRAKQRWKFSFGYIMFLDLLRSFSLCAYVTVTWNHFTTSKKINISQMKISNFAGAVVILLRSSDLACPFPINCQRSGGQQGVINKENKQGHALRNSLVDDARTGVCYTSASLHDRALTYWTVGVRVISSKKVCGCICTNGFYLVLLTRHSCFSLLEQF